MIDDIEQLGRELNGRTITIADAIKEREKLEARILSLIRDFQIETGLNPLTIDIQALQSCSKEVTIYGVQVEVLLQ